MTPADKFYMNYSPNCCRRADCADHNCPGRGTEQPTIYNPGKYELPNPAGAEAALKYVLAGVGFIATLIAALIWGVK